MRTSRLPRIFAVVVALVAVVSLLGLSVLNLRYADTALKRLDSIWVLAWLGFPVVGALLATRKPANRIGWTLLGAGAGIALGLSLVAYADAEATFGVTMPASSWMAVAAAVCIAGGFSLVPFVILLFPRDELRGRWGWVTRLAAGLLLVQLAVWALQPGFETDSGTVIDNPIPLTDGVIGEVASALTGPLAIVFVGLALAAIARSLVHYRRSSGIERLQRKWVVFSAALFPVLMGAGMAVSYADELWGQVLVNTAFVVSIDGIAIAMGVAILKFRLYDIDVVINRTLVFGSLALFITGVYVAIVVGVGWLVGQGDEPSVALSIVATVVVAVSFQPVRQRLQHLANRVVYGQRATPYEVLAGFSRQQSDQDDPDRGGTFEQVCRLLVEGTSAGAAAVWRVEGEGLELVAAEPAGEAAQAGPPPDAVVHDLDHDGERLGVLAVVVPAGEALSSDERDLLEHLAGGLGLVLRNTRLTQDLRERVVELEASRARLLAAGDQVRRDIEQRLRQGPQAVLATIVDRLTELTDRARQQGADRTPTVLESVTEVVRGATTAVGEFARGVFPPVLEHGGLDGALRVQADAAPLPVTVHTDLDGRYPRDVETALFFTASEALQNIAKYANATSAHVALRDSGERLTLQVVDDGDGFDPETTSPGTGTTNMAERIDTINGQLTIDSTPGHGTTVTATVPLESRAPRPDDRVGHLVPATQALGVQTPPSGGAAR